MTTNTIIVLHYVLPDSHVGDCIVSTVADGIAHAQRNLMWTVGPIGLVDGPPGACPHHRGVTRMNHPGDPMNPTTILSPCPNCGKVTGRSTYDIGSGPELSCADCEWCWGANGQDLKPLVAPDWGKGVATWTIRRNPTAHDVEYLVLRDGKHIATANNEHDAVFIRSALVEREDRDEAAIDLMMSRGGKQGNADQGGWHPDPHDAPIAVAARVMGAVRELDGGDHPVASLVFIVGRTGETYRVDLPPGVVLQLMVGLAQFSDQLHRGS